METVDDIVWAVFEIFIWVGLSNFKYIDIFLKYLVGYGNYCGGV